MDGLKSFLATADILNGTDAVLDTAEILIRNSNADGAACEDPRLVGAGDAASLFGCTDCNDGERAILAGYVSLVRQCMELAEKVKAAQA